VDNKKHTGRSPAAVLSLQGKLLRIFGPEELGLRSGYI